MNRIQLDAIKRIASRSMNDIDAPLRGIGYCKDRFGRPLFCVSDGNVVVTGAADVDAEDESCQRLADLVDQQVREYRYRPLHSNIFRNCTRFNLRAVQDALLAAGCQSNVYLSPTNMIVLGEDVVAIVMPL